MFKKKTDINTTALRMEIDSLFASMSAVPRDSDEYAKMVTQMKVLYELREVDHKNNNAQRLSPETIVTVLANLLGIAMIVEYEKANVITTKAVPMLMKLFR